MRPTLLLVAFPATLLACSTDPPSPSEVRSHIDSDLGNVLRETKTAWDGSTASLPGAASLALIDGTIGSSSAAARLVAPLRSALAPARSRGTASNADPSSSFDPDAAIKWLNEHLFTDQNYLGNGVFRVPPELLCTTTTVDPNGVAIDTVDPDCVAQVEQAELRIRVESDSGLRFWIQLDADHDEPIGFLLRHDEVAVTLDLDDAAHALIALAQAFGEQAPNAALSGQVTADLTVLGAQHARASLSFDRALSIKVADQGADLDGADAVRVTSASGEIASIELDAIGAAVLAHLGLGETTVHVPGDTTTAELPTDLDLAGATADATFDGAVLAIDHLSLGSHTTTVFKGGVQGLAIDLNPNDGRQLRATVTRDAATGLETLAVTPLLDLRTAVDHGVLGDTPPEYDVVRVQLTGAVRGMDGSNQVEVLGSLALTTNPAQYGFSASAGQCVTSTDAYDPATSESYTTYAVGVCP